MEPPVVATPCGPVPELVDDGVTGFIPTPRPASSTPCTRSMRSTGHSAECRRRKVHTDRKVADRLALYQRLIRRHRSDYGPWMGSGFVAPTAPPPLPTAPSSHKARTAAQRPEWSRFTPSRPATTVTAAVIPGLPPGPFRSWSRSGRPPGPRRPGTWRRRHAPRRGRNAPGHGRASRCHPAEGRPAHAGKN